MSKQMLAAIDLGLLSLAFTSIIAACWAYSLKSTNDRIANLESQLSALKADQPRSISK
ncbi:MAG: hypothetical protein JNL18_00235 [Planctomycetaceae bacterium]|nr:hypothetical protein [Planctomycetaceae bacterium]